MDTSKKILLISGTCICLGIGIFAFLNNTDNSTQTIEKKDYSDVYNNIEVETEIKSVQFDTIEEMMAYSEAINTITGLEEATNFISEFYSSCTQNNLELMLTYYNSEIWDNIMNMEAFPCYDSTATVSFAIEDLNVVEGKKEFTYVAKYNLVIKDSSTDEKLATLERKDTFELSKLFEKIQIEDYQRETIKENYF